MINRRVGSVICLQALCCIIIIIGSFTEICASPPVVGQIPKVFIKFSNTSLATLSIKKVHSSSNAATSIEAFGMFQIVQADKSNTETKMEIWINIQEGNWNNAALFSIKIDWSKWPYIEANQTWGTKQLKSKIGFAAGYPNSQIITISL